MHGEKIMVTASTTFLKYQCKGYGNNYLELQNIPHNFWEKLPYWEQFL